MTDRRAIGAWSGALELEQTRLRMMLHVLDGPEGMAATLDSPDQGASGLPGKVVAAGQDGFEIHFPSIHASYRASVGNDELSGVFDQLGVRRELNFVRSMAAAKVKRPQEPQAPYPYQISDVSFPVSSNDKAAVALAGSLSLPADTPIKAALILASGSGAHDRNEEVCGHKPFLVMADHLTRKGYAVLRYDNFGVGESGGDINDCSLSQSINALLAAVRFVTTCVPLRTRPLGLIGHSEGALAGGAVAAQSPPVKALVMLAGPGLPGYRIYRDQIEAIARGSGAADASFPWRLRKLDSLLEIILQASLDEDLTERLLPMVREAALLDLAEGEAMDELVRSHVATYNHRAFREFIKCDPTQLLANIKIPVLALAGENDVQVSARPNMEALREIFDRSGGMLTTKVMNALNHLFQTSDSGLPQHYGAIEETFSNHALQEIEHWLDVNLAAKRQ